MLKLIYSTQTCATAVRIALEEAGLEYEGTEVSWFRKLNLEVLEQASTLGQVPVLQEGGRTLTQTAAILEYVADRSRVKPLLPAEGTWGRTEARSWLTYLAADMQKAFWLMALPKRWLSQPQAQQEMTSAGRTEVEKHLGRINAALAGKEFLLGDQFSVVDIYAFTLLGWCQSEWCRAAGLSLAEKENLIPYIRRILARPAVQKILKDEDLLGTFPF